MRRSQAGAPARADAEKKDKKPKATSLVVPMPDPATEQVIIAAALVDLKTRKKLLAILPSDSFFGEGHPEAWDVIRELDRRELSYDPATVTQLTGGKVDAGYLDDLIRVRPMVAPNLQHHLDVLRWNRARVEAIRGPVGGLIDALSNASTSPEKVISLARASVTTLEGHSSLRYLREPGQLRRSAMEEIRKRRAGLACYPFGIEGFDRYADGPLEGQWRCIPGAAPGKMTVITGSPGSGKTTVTAAIALAQANMGRRVLFGAWEQGAELTLELVAQTSLGISRSALATGAITNEEEGALDAEMERLEEFIRFFELPYDAGASESGKPWELNAQHLDTIFEYLSATSPDVAIFDLWRYIVSDMDPDSEEKLLRRQRAMLKQVGVHGILVHQLTSKELEKRVDKTPTREALKGSSAWFEVPDTIIAVHREFLWKPVPDDVLKLLLLKQRQGVWPLAVDCAWDPDRAQITAGRCAEVARQGVKGSIDGFLDGDIIPASAAAHRERTKGTSSNGKRRRL